jgi:hypothetical protein
MEKPLVGKELEEMLQKEIDQTEQQVLHLRL